MSQQRSSIIIVVATASPTRRLAEHQFPINFGTRSRSRETKRKLADSAALLFSFALKATRISYAHTHVVYISAFHIYRL